MEQSLKRMAKDDFDLDAAEMEDRGRVDIRYASAGGEHVIVELKRYSVPPTSTSSGCRADGTRLLFNRSSRSKV